MIWAAVLEDSPPQLFRLCMEPSRFYVRPIRLGTAQRTMSRLCYETRDSMTRNGYEIWFGGRAWFGPSADVLYIDRIDQIPHRRDNGAARLDMMLSCLEDCTRIKNMAIDVSEVWRGDLGSHTACTVQILSECFSVARLYFLIPKPWGFVHCATWQFDETSDPERPVYYRLQPGKQFSPLEGDTRPVDAYRNARVSWELAKEYLEGIVRLWGPGPQPMIEGQLLPEAWGEGALEEPPEL